MIRRKLVTRRNRRRPDPSQLAQPVDAVATPTIDTGDVVLDFDVAVSLKGVPACTLNGEGPASATRPTPTRVVVHFADAANPTDNLVIPVNDPAIRTMTGGYSQPLAYTFP